jgi:hypothetical protein
MRPVSLALAIAFSAFKRRKQVIILRSAALDVNKFEMVHIQVFFFIFQIEMHCRLMKQLSGDVCCEILDTSA